MKRAKVVFRPEARSDLRHIYMYIADASQDRQTARNYTDRIFQRCASIAEAPLSGTMRADLAAGLRMVIFERTVLIFYMFEANTVRIINVIHGRRDTDRLMRGPIVPP